MVPRLVASLGVKEGELPCGASTWADTRVEIPFAPRDAQLVDAITGRAILEKGEASALLVIPKGFTRDVLDEVPTTLTLVRNPSEGILPEIAEQTAGMLADVLDGGRRVFDGPVDALRPYFDEGARAPSDAEVVATSLAVKRAIEANADLVWPPAITLDGPCTSTAPRSVEPS